MNNLSERLAKLTPEQRDLLRSRLQKEVGILRRPKDQPFVPKKLDLAAEVTLAPEIQPPGPLTVDIASPSAVFVTGGTGFLGAFLLRDLLAQTQADIYCLTRAASGEEARQRLRKNLERYDLWRENFAERLIPVLGDISKPQLGLSDEEFSDLGQRLDSIYHSAAILNYILPYTALKKPNVQGTQEILRLACLGKTKPVHYVSSVAVFESSAYVGRTITEEDDLNSTEGMFIGYSHSKWVAERIVLLGRDRGIPVTIHRASFISGDSTTGITNTSDFVCMMLKQCFQMGVLPDLDFTLDASPVNYVSGSIVHLSLKPESLGQVFHLQHPQPVPLATLVSACQNLGLDIRLVPYREWTATLEKLAENSDEPFYRLLPFFTQEYEDGLTIPELNAVDKRPAISCAATEKALAGSGIVCPPPDARVLGRFLSYFIKSGFLELPARKRLNPKLLYVLSSPQQKVAAAAIASFLVLGLGRVLY